MDGAAEESDGGDDAGPEDGAMEASPEDGSKNDAATEVEYALICVHETD